MGEQHAHRIRMFLQSFIVSAMYQYDIDNHLRNHLRNIIYAS